MNIDRLDLIAFGHLTNISLDLSAGPHRFHLIVGANESGKSTSMRAIDAWLFGFPHQTSDDYVHPGTKLRVGGILRSDEMTLHCIRRKGRKTTLRAGDDDAVVDEGRLQTMLGGVDQHSFGTQFLLDHDELLRGGRQILQGEGELGEMLFAAGAGLGRLRKIQGQLRADCEALFKPRGKARMNEAFTKLKKLRDDLKQAQVPPAQYARLQSEVAKQRGLIAGLKRKSDELSSRRAAAAAAVEAISIIPQWRTAKDELAEVVDAPLLSDDFAARRRDLFVEQSVAENSVQRLEDQRKNLRGQFNAIGEDLEIRKHKVEIESLVRELPIREKAEADRAGSMSVVLAAQERDLRKGLRDLANSPGPVETEDVSDPREDLGRQVDNLRLSETQRGKVGRLASAYEKLVGGCDDARRQLGRLHGRIEQADRELSELPSLADGDVAGRILDEIGQPRQWIDQARQAQSDVQRWTQRCRSTLKRLGVEGSPEQVVAISLPDPTDVQRVANAIDIAAEECRLVRRSVTDIERQVETAEAEYEAAETQAHMPTLEELNDARRTRDEAINAWTKRMLIHVDGSSDDSIDSDAAAASELPSLVGRADQIVDQLRMHHAEVHRRSTAATNVQALTSQRKQQQAELQRLEADLTSAQQEWESLWTSIGVTPRSPEAMTVWVGEHRKLIEQVEQLTDARVAHEDATDKIEFTLDRLRTLAQDSSKDAQGSDGLLCLYDHVSSLRHQWQQAQKKRDSLSQQLRGWKSDCSEAKSTLERRTDALASWQQEWDAATSSLQTASPTPDDVLPVLDAIKDLTNIKKERDDMLHRMASIRDETSVFLRSADRLLASFEVDGQQPVVEGEDTATALQRFGSKIYALNDRCKHEAMDANARRQLQTQLSQVDVELTEANETLQRFQALRDEFCKEAGCKDPSELPTIEARSQRRREATEKVRQAEVNLARLAGGKAIEEFVEPIQDVQPGVIEDQLAAADEEKEHLNSQIEEAQRELGRLDHQESAIDGGETASELSQQIQSHLGKIGRDAEDYVRLKLAGAILRRAIDHYRNENQDPVLKVAEVYFRTLTCGRYDGLKVDYDDKDTPVLHGTHAGGDVPAGALSSGTADALYLSLRLASLKHQADQGKPIPLIVDDCLIQLDDKRASAALKVLSDLSQTNQVILFTHHHHLLDLASEHLSSDDYHVHQLGM